MSTPNSQSRPDKRVRHFRQILLWPLQLLPIRAGSQIQRHWEVLHAAAGADARAPASAASACPWHEVVDEFTGDPQQFQERHYNELVTFLPYVQRFLYGEGRSTRAIGGSGTGGSGTGGSDTGGSDTAGRSIEGGGTGSGTGSSGTGSGGTATRSGGAARGAAAAVRNAAMRAESASSPMRVFRRDDIAAVRLVARPNAAPLVLQIAHIDLYFFYDIDVVLLNVEVHGADLPLAQAQDALYRFGRAYPAGWDEQGQALHSMARVEWLDRDGQVLAASDTEDRSKFLAFVCQHRAPRIAAHWAYVLYPLVLDHSEQPGAIRYRPLEYFRMPLMAYLALDDPRQLTRDDFIRLGLVTACSEDEPLPYSQRAVADFEERYCYDRFWSDTVAAGDESAQHNTRYLCCGHALIVVGTAQAPYFLDARTGVLAQFRHQHFLLFLIAHFQKATLLMFSDRLVDALKRLDIGDAESVKRFKRAIRQLFEIFLRFTHRYWFHEISEQAQARALFRLCSRHLGLDPLYVDVKERIHDMDEYLDSDSLRRQANTVVRLTVVTTFGMIGTITTGFLGMNLIAAADQPLAARVAYFTVVLVITIWLTAYTVVKSKRLSDWLDALSDERMSLRDKLRALWSVWKTRG